MSVVRHGAQERLGKFHQRRGRGGTRRGNSTLVRNRSLESIVHVILYSYDRRLVKRCPADNRAGDDGGGGEYRTRSNVDGKADEEEDTQASTVEKKDRRDSWRPDRSSGNEKRQRDGTTTAVVTGAPMINVVVVRLRCSTYPLAAPAHNGICTADSLCWPKQPNRHPSARRRSIARA